MNDTSSSWIIREEGFDPAKERFYESIFFQGNGRFGFRGFRDEGSESPAWERTTFAAGFFGELKAGTTDMVNCPDMFYTRIYCGGDAVTPRSARTAGVLRELDLSNGILSSEYTYLQVDGARLQIRSFRFPSLADRRLAVQYYEFSAPDRDLDLSIEAGIDGSTLNSPIHDDQLKKNSEVVSLRKTIRSEQDADGLLRYGAVAEGTGIALEIALTIIAPEDSRPEPDTHNGNGQLLRSFSFTVPRGERRSISRVIAFATSRDPFGETVLAKNRGTAGTSAFQISSTESDRLAEAVARTVREAASRGVDALRREQEAAWQRIWKSADIEVTGERSLTQGLRYSIFQLVQSAAMDDDGVSIGARGLSHGRYKGCYFWDTDVFMLPFFALTFPEAAQRLLQYRYRTLEGARANARTQGVAGARYSWMCTLNGREQCDTWDIGLSEIHITADVAWAVLSCREWLGNDEWFLSRGVEILIESARYWRSRFTRNRTSGRWDLLWVKGPDEYGGVTINNTFTVAMARENLSAAVRAVAECRDRNPAVWTELARRVHFDPSETLAWTDVAENCVLPFDEEQSVYLEDELFLRKEPFDFRSVKQGDEPLYRTVPYDRLQRLRVAKQADLILLGRLLPGFFSSAQEQAVWDFYEPITAHDSTLSFGAHAEAAARLGLTEKAVDYLTRSARLDLDDLMKNVCEEGLHLAACGGAWRALVFGFAGLHFRANIPVLDPVPLSGWEGIRFSFEYRGRGYNADVSSKGWFIHDASGSSISSGNVQSMEAGV